MSRDNRVAGGFASSQSSLQPVIKSLLGQVRRSATEMASPYPCNRLQFPRCRTQRQCHTRVLNECSSHPRQNDRSHCIIRRFLVLFQAPSHAANSGNRRWRPDGDLWAIKCWFIVDSAQVDQVSGTREIPVSAAPPQVSFSRFSRSAPTAVDDCPE